MKITDNLNLTSLLTPQEYTDTLTKHIRTYTTQTQQEHSRIYPGSVLKQDLHLDCYAPLSSTILKYSKDDYNENRIPIAHIH